jgi:hypothetical protein
LYPHQFKQIQILRGRFAFTQTARDHGSRFLRTSERFSLKKTEKKVKKWAGLHVKLGHPQRDTKVGSPQNTISYYVSGQEKRRKNMKR